MSDENKELNNNTGNNVPPSGGNSADVEDILNEIRQQQNFTPKKPAEQPLQEGGQPTQEQSVQQDEKTEQADSAEETAAAQPTVQFDRFEEISSTSNMQAQHGGSFSSEPQTAAPVTEVKPKKKKTKFVIIGIAGVIILLAAAFCGTMLLNPEVIPSIAPVTEVKGSSAQSKNAVFAKGVKVGGIDVGGKTLKEATALIIVKDKDIAPEFKVDVVNGDMTLTYNQDDFNYTYNTTEVINQAFQYSKDVQKALQDGSIDRLSKPAGDNVVVDDKAGTVDFKIQCRITDKSIEAVVKKSAKKMDIAAVEPHVSKFDPSAKGAKMFQYAEGEDGVAVDRKKLYDDIAALFTKGAASGSVTVQTQAAKPKHTMDEVKQSTGLIAKFSTVSTNTYNANHNMQTALKAINGKIIAPGKQFSFNECTGNSNLASNGYLPASVIENGEYTSGYGGGICQAATTIYNAGVRANMGIEERYPHLWCSPYVYGGLDATIDYGNLDLKLKNNTEFQIFFKTYMDGTTLYCEIYGWQSPKFDEVRTESHNTWVGEEEYGFAAQRVYYLNGKVVDREDLPDSSYSLSNGHYVVAGDPGNVSTKIKKSTDDTKTESAKPASAKPTGTQQNNSKPVSSSSKPDEPNSSSSKPDGSSSSSESGASAQSPTEQE